MAEQLRVGTLISGGGTNLQAIIDAIGGRYLDAEIAVVVSNRRKAYGLKRAEKAGIPTLTFPLKPFRDAGRSRGRRSAPQARPRSRSPGGRPRPAVRTSRTRR